MIMIPFFQVSQTPMYQDSIGNDGEKQGLGLVGNNGTRNDILSPGGLGYRNNETLGVTGGVGNNIGEDMFLESNNGSTIYV